MHILSGSLNYRGTEYFISLIEYKSKTVWYLISKVHKEDIVNQITGKELVHKELTTLDVTRSTISEGYVLEVLSRTRVSGDIHVYGSKIILDQVLDLMGIAASYHFSKEYIRMDNSHEHLGVRSREFDASDGRMTYSYSKRDGLFTTLLIDYQGITLSMSDSTVYKVPKELPLVKVEQQEAVKASISSVQSLDYKTLKEILDMSWYEAEDGTVLKNYFPVTNIKEFEEKVIDGLMEEYNRCLQTGEEFVIGLDTETSGLKLYNLSPENPSLDRIVCIPISWRDNESAVIFVDMEYFNNVPINYVLHRLAPFIGWRTGEPVKFTRRKVSSVNNKVISMHIFGTEDSKVEEDNFTWEDIGEYEIDRDKITVTGHNVTFDGRAFYRHGLKTYWDDDSMQLAFNLNPKVVKGNNKLKTITRRLFNAETPELSDILGKGNEDKFRYITDIRVACIYAGADTDYSRLTRRELIRLSNLMNPKLYRDYKKQDVPILNLLYIPEYNGMRTAEDLFKREAEIVEKDLEKIREFLYTYVGTVVDFRNKRDALYKRVEAGMMSIEEFQQAVRNIKTERNYYEFKLSGDQVREVLYGILGYPVKVRTKPTAKFPDGRPSVDKIAMKRLMAYTNDKPASAMKQDLISSDGKTKLIEASRFNKYKYPVAYVLSKYGQLYKEWTSYYQPMREQNLEGKIFKSFSTTAIETRRIMNPAQTMKSSLKALVIPYTDDHYMCVFDQMQVEPRIMTSFSGSVPHIEKYRNPEKDYHTETASDIIKIKPHKLPKTVRKNYKAVSLGIPYGLGDRKMCANIHNEVNDDTLYQTRKDIDLWKKHNAHIWNKLQEFRKQALEPIEIHPEVRKFITVKEEELNAIYGKISGMFSFYRLFNLDNLDRKKKGSIERAAGNYPIQETAAEIFRIILQRFDNRCRMEGILDNILWHMLIHDELVMSVHKSVHPFYLFKLLYESCTVTFPGHTTYFIGINIGNNWLDGKKDENEAPVLFVKRIIERWDAGEFRDDDYVNAVYTYRNAKGDQVTEYGVKAYVTKHIHEYIRDRIGEVVRSIQPDCDKEPIKMAHLLEHFENYTVRAYVTTYYPMNYEVENMNDDDAVYCSKFESWVLEYFGEGKEIVNLDGVKKKVYQNSSEIISLYIEEDYDEEQDAEDYWTFDSEDLEESGVGIVFVQDEDLEEEEEFLSQFDTSRKDAKSIADLFISTAPEYSYVKVVNGQLFIKLERAMHMEKVKKFLLPKESKEGYKVVLDTPLSKERWIFVPKDIDLKEIDDFVGGLYNANRTQLSKT